MWGNDSCWKVIYMGDVYGPEKMKIACVKTIHARTMVRGFNGVESRALMEQVSCTQRSL